MCSKMLGSVRVCLYILSVHAYTDALFSVAGGVIQSTANDRSFRKLLFGATLISASSVRATSASRQQLTTSGLVHPSLLEDRSLLATGTVVPH